MNENSNMPDALNELLNSNRQSQPVRATSYDIVHEAVVEGIAELPDSAFKWNWSKWRYEFVFDGVRSFVTWSEYRDSRRVRALRPVTGNR